MKLQKDAYIKDSEFKTVEEAKEYILNLDKPIPSLCGEMTNEAVIEMLNCIPIMEYNDNE